MQATRSGKEGVGGGEWERASGLGGPKEESQGAEEEPWEWVEPGRPLRQGEDLEWEEWVFLPFNPPGPFWPECLTAPSLSYQ